MACLSFLCTFTSSLAAGPLSNYLVLLVLTDCLPFQDPNQYRKVYNSEMRIQVRAAAETVYVRSRAASSVLLQSSALGLCQSALGPILPNDTRREIAEKCVAIAAAKTAGKLREWVAKNLTKAFFRYRRFLLTATFCLAN